MTTSFALYDEVTRREIPAETPNINHLDWDAHLKIARIPFPKGNASSSSSSGSSLQNRATVIQDSGEISIEQAWLDLPPEQSLDGQKKIDLKYFVSNCSKTGQLYLPGYDFVSIPKALYLLNVESLKVSPKTLFLLLQDLPNNAPLLSSLNDLYVVQSDFTSTNNYSIQGLEKFGNLTTLAFTTSRVALNCDLRIMQKLINLSFDDFTYTNLVSDEEKRAFLADKKIVHSSFRIEWSLNDHDNNFTIRHYFHHEVVNIDEFFKQVMIIDFQFGDIKNESE